MDMPFSITFHESFHKVHVVTTFTNDYFSSCEIDDQDIVKVKENMDLKLFFESSDPAAKLYLDVLDTLPEKVEVSEGELFVTPSSEAIQLYENSDDYCPLIPGHYQIKVCAGGETYFSWLKVIPKQIDEEQWYLMRDEVECTLSGLSQELVRKNRGIGSGPESDALLTKNGIRKILVIEGEYRKFSLCLQEIKNKPRMNVRKNYNLAPVEKKAFLDKNSIRYRAKHPESASVILSPRYFEDFNILENQWIVFILRHLIREVGTISDFLSKYISKLNQEIVYEQNLFGKSQDMTQAKEKTLQEMDHLLQFAKKFRNECERFLAEEWVKAVAIEKPRRLPHVMNLDSRYNRIYRLFRMLRNDAVTVDFLSDYRFYWKRTDKLYEIWGFIKLMKSIQSDSIGFSAVEGWIYDFDVKDNRLTVPFLSPGTSVKFSKGHISLILTYDEVLPSKSKDATFEKPLFSVNKNKRPDARIEVYANEEYIGSVVFDFKYRPQKLIWGSEADNYVKQQLDNYRNSLNSKFLYAKSKPGQWDRFKAVHEVWAIYPRDKYNRQYDEAFEDYQIRLFQLSPGDDQDELEDLLKDSIERIIRNSDES